MKFYKITLGLDEYLSNQEEEPVETESPIITDSEPQESSNETVEKVVIQPEIIEVESSDDDEPVPAQITDSSKEPESNINWPEVEDLIENVQQPWPESIADSQQPSATTISSVPVTATTPQIVHKPAQPASTEKEATNVIVTSKGAVIPKITIDVPKSAPLASISKLPAPQQQSAATKIPQPKTATVPPTIVQTGSQQQQQAVKMPKQKPQQQQQQQPQQNNHTQQTSQQGRGGMRGGKKKRKAVNHQPHNRLLNNSIAISNTY